MNFSFLETKIKNVFIIKPTFFNDNRGQFFETYNKKTFFEAGLDFTFVQDNQSNSKKGVIRGLHFQKMHPQAKLAHVTRGEVFDVAVDLRKNSKTYGEWVGVFLSEHNRNMFLVPRGFAHGILVISDYAEYYYKCDDYFYPEDQGGISWNDPTIDIKWPNVGEIILSEKDKKLPTLIESKIEFCEERI